MTDSSLPEKIPAWIAWGAGLAIAAGMLLAAGQPILSDDLWIHLSLGDAYLTQGPWLAGDPLLADPLGAPLPAAWGTDVVFALTQQMGGFQALRLLHVILVAGLLGLLASILQRAGRSPWVTALGTGAFITLAAYRLVQIRPHLFSMLALLILYRLLFEHRKVPTPRQIAAAVVVFALWANLHASFVLAPILTLAGLGGLVLAALLENNDLRRETLARAWAIALVVFLGTLATLLNPSGIEPHLAFWIAGDETPRRAGVADEWRPVNLFAWPQARLPPAPLTWAILWCLWLATPAVGLASFLKTGRTSGSIPEASDATDESPARAGLDPALVVMAGAALWAPLIAVRFAWLGVLPLIVLAQASRGLRRRLPGRSQALDWAGALAACALAAAFIAVGPWPMISGIMPGNLSGYSAPYPAGKYHSQATWMLADAELEGTLYAEYSAGGFYGFWLAPEIRTFLNGTLNVEPETIAANRPILERRGERPGESFSELLDRHGINLFLGGHLPQQGRSDRPWYYTAAHLERTPGWTTIFRNLTSAVYLRTNPANQQNLARVASFYRRQGIPFDPERGFEIERVIAAQPQWAMQNGVVPIYFQDLLKRGSMPQNEEDAVAGEHLALLFATLGLYEKAIALDRSRLKTHPNDPATRRRLAWSLLRSGDAKAALEIAGPLQGGGDALGETIFRAAQAATAGELAPGQTHILPLLTQGESTHLTSAIVRPGARTSKNE